MTKILTILALIPRLIEAIKSVEAAVPLSGKGKEKMEAILDIMKDTGEDISGILPLISKTISRLVSLFNQTGVFQKA